MFKFGLRSLLHLESCHIDLQRIAHQLIKEIDVAVICGHRCQEDQDEAYTCGRSKLMWPNSKHNRFPSEAMDVVPYPVDWSNIPRFADMCRRIERIAKDLEIEIRLGRDFSFKDWPHVELVHVGAHEF